MKKTLLLFILCCVSLVGRSVNWYSTAGDITSFANWWSVSGGTGSHPTSFSTAGDLWVVQAAMTIPAGTWNLGGKLSLESGNLQKTGTGATTMNIDGYVELHGATFITSAAGTGKIIMNLKDYLHVENTAYISSGSPGTNFNYIYFNNTSSTLAAPQNLTWSSTATSNYTSLIVNPNVVVDLSGNLPVPQNSDSGLIVRGTFAAHSNIISSGGLAKFTLASGGTFRTSAPTGINGNIVGMGTSTYSNAANYVFDGASPQVTGTNVPATIASGGSVMVYNLAGLSLSQTTTFSSGAIMKLGKGPLNNTATNIVMNSGSNVYRDTGTFAVTPTTYSGINVTYTNLGYNSLLTPAANEFPNTFTGNVIVNKTGAAVHLNANKVLTGNITITAGALNVSASNYNISLTGTWTNNASAGAFVPGTASVTLAGATSQLLTGLSGTNFNVLVVNNAAGVVLGQSETVNSILQLLLGSIDITDYNLIMGPAASGVVGTLSGTRMIIANGTGQMRKQMNALGTYFFPIGDNSGNYTPITMTVSGGTVNPSAYIGVRVKDLKHPNNANLSNYLKRYWTVVTSNITLPVYAVSATYVTTDVVGSEAAMSMGKYTTALPWVKFGAANTVAHSLSASAVGDTLAFFTGITTAGPTVGVIGGTTICAYTGSAPLTVSSTTGDPTFTYSWAPATGLSVTTGASVIASPTTGTTPSTVVYTVTVTDGNGFQSTASTTVSINPTPAAIGGPDRVCVSSTNTLTNTLPGGVWTSSNTLTASIGASSGVISGLNFGTTIISYTMPSTGCYTVAVVTVNTAPSAITGTNVLCVNDTVVLHDTTIWGTWSSTNTARATIDTYTGKVVGTGAGTVTLVYSTGAGSACPLALYTVTVNPLPIPITGSTRVCVGAISTLTDLTAGGTWTLSDTSLARIDTFTGVLTGHSMGVATVTYKLTATGCYVTFKDTVNPIAPVVGPDTVCQGSSAFFTDIVGGGTWASSNPAIAAATSGTGMLTGIDSGITYVAYIMPTGCSATKLVRIQPALPPVAGFSHVCHGSTITMSNAVSGGVWSTSNPFVGAIGGSSGILTGMATDTVTVFYTKPWGCMSKKIVTVDPLPTPVLTYNSTTSTLSVPAIYVTYQWYKASGVLPGETNAVYNLPFYSDSFYVVVTDANGCTGSTGKMFIPFVVVGQFTAKDFRVFPNPTADAVFISAPIPVRAIVSSVDGKTEIEQSNAKEIHLGSLAPGLHIITLLDEQGKILKHEKLIKE